MPYDFTFKRTANLENVVALKMNISLAIELTNLFSEIIDPNSNGSNLSFTRTLIDLKKEFPELHFHLECNVDNFFYYLSFWKDYLFIELGAGGDVIERFRHLRDYSKVIFRHDFQIEDPITGNILPPDIGFDRHIEEYNKWSGFVDSIKQHHKP